MQNLESNTGRSEERLQALDDTPSEVKHGCSYHHPEVPRDLGRFLRFCRSVVGYLFGVFIEFGAALRAASVGQQCVWMAPLVARFAERAWE
jgi:hypothetical protein